VADFNGDGYGNVLFRNEFSGQLSFAAMIAGNFSGLGAATAGVNRYFFGGYGDVNGDGYADVVVQDPGSRTIYVAEQNGSGTPSYQTLPAVPGWRVEGVGNITDDGFAEHRDPEPDQRRDRLLRCAQWHFHRRCRVHGLACGGYRRRQRQRV
jgi:hypothetical protein